MADITGPISSLPGSIHASPDNTMCDEHPNVLAVCRVQGETDSFGSEMLDLCQACLDDLRKENANLLNRIEKCDYCKSYATGLRDLRDYEEGSCGPVYRVCQPCIQRVRQSEQEDYDYSFSDWD